MSYDSSDQLQSLQPSRHISHACVSNTNVERHMMQESSVQGMKPSTSLIIHHKAQVVQASTAQSACKLTNSMPHGRSEKLDGLERRRKGRT